MRALALTYVTGMTPRPAYPAVSFNVCPGIGEYFVFPAETLTGACEIMVLEGIPGGPMDCWDDVRMPAEHLARSKRIAHRFVNAFDDPSDFQAWFMTPEAAQAYLAQLGAAP